MRNLIAAALLALSCGASGQTFIRVNQLGYLPGSVKVAVLVSKDSALECSSFSLREAISGKSVLALKASVAYGTYGGFRKGFRLDFSQWNRPGGYFVEAAGAQSPEFRIDNDVYRGTPDFLLRYLRQQRCGFNPFLRDSCHTRDGYALYSEKADSTFVDVTGGWHDAADYLQYATTSATAAFQMALAYREFPNAFGDAFNAAGLPGPNGIPDVVDEITWGLDWLLKMNPASGVIYQQVADDRDHQLFRLPTQDTVSYGFGRGRPVYRATGHPQGLMQYKNQSTGIASIAGKFASSFALGAMVTRDFNPSYADRLARKAGEAFATGLSHPGYSQTAPCRAPYFYEEENWRDDMEMAAASLFHLTGGEAYRTSAREYGRAEGVVPWMLTNTARHYQWYPFVNIGHYLLAKDSSDASAAEFRAIMRDGISKVAERGISNPFLFGIPYLWCSNNYVSSYLMDLIQYRQATRDSSFQMVEAAMRDWLFGCNPWGTSMVIGLPKGGVSPRDPHSAFSHTSGYPVDGGLVDGPVKNEIFSSLKGLHLSKPDLFQDAQSTMAVYHDDWADYSSNEPTMDGTATLVYSLAALATEGRTGNDHRVTERDGGVIGMDSTAKKIYLVFTGDEFAEGGATIVRTLHTAGIKGSFFFTGKFYRNQAFTPLVRQLRDEGHYLGAHSDKHLLYCSWEKRDSLLVSRHEFLDDLRSNYRVMDSLGIDGASAKYFMPPFEWYNREVNDWCRQLGLTLVNFTPGVRTNADYTVPSMGKSYMSSEAIRQSVLSYESSRANGLNGALVLVHVGTSPERVDKFYDHLADLIADLKKKGYTFGRLP